MATRTQAHIPRSVFANSGNYTLRCTPDPVRPVTTGLFSRSDAVSVRGASPWMGCTAPSNNEPRPPHMARIPAWLDFELHVVNMSENCCWHPLQCTGIDDFEAGQTSKKCKAIRFPTGATRESGVRRVQWKASCVEKYGIYHKLPLSASAVSHNKITLR